jgi:hypothetical protein
MVRRSNFHAKNKTINEVLGEFLTVVDGSILESVAAGTGCLRNAPSGPPLQVAHSGQTDRRMFGPLFCKFNHWFALLLVRDEVCVAQESYIHMQVNIQGCRKRYAQSDALLDKERGGHGGATASAKTINREDGEAMKLFAHRHLQCSAVQCRER